MKYYCDPCEYESANKSDYNMHIKSDAHLQVIKEKPEIEDDDEFICTNCNKSFSHASSLSRHKSKTCKKGEQVNQVMNNETIEQPIEQPVELMDDDSEMHLGNDLILELIEAHRRGELHKYLGDIIISIYEEDGFM